MDLKTWWTLNGKTLYVDEKNDELKTACEFDEKNGIWICSNNPSYSNIVECNIEKRYKNISNVYPVPSFS